MTLIDLAKNFLRAHKWQVVALFLCQIGQVLLSLWLPAINARIIDEGIIPQNTSLIWQQGIIMLIVSLLQISLLATAAYLASRIAMSFGKDLRSQIFRKVQNLSEIERQEFGAPTLITRATNDVVQIQMVLLFSFVIMIIAPIMGIGGIIMALAQDKYLSILLVIMVPLLALIIGVVMAMLIPRYQIQQKRIDRINTLLREQLSGVRVIRAFGREGYLQEKFATASGKLRQVGLQIGWLWAFLIPSTSLIVGWSSAGVLWLGASRIAAGKMQIGALTAYITYLLLIFFSVMAAGMMAMVLPRGEVSARRIKEILEIQPAIASPLHPQPLPAQPHSLQLRKVSLQYPQAEAAVLQNIDFTVQPGKIYGIIGSTGAGKSSLLRLLPRLIDPSAGEIYLGNIPLTKFALPELRQKIAYVPQKAFLFSGSIASNIAGSLPGSSAAARQYAVSIPRIKKALHIAGADFVEKLPNGIESKVESSGSNFSGGQRQRLSIARAVYRCLSDTNGENAADFLLLDDSFSALDYATEAAIRKNLRQELSHIGIVIVAQRVASIQAAEEIIVLESGKIAGRGTHAELLATCRIYQEIVDSQGAAAEEENE